jgi:hypothetical protein
MPEPMLSMTVDDDLPRTIRRERDARQREAREREARDDRERLSSSPAPARREPDPDFAPAPAGAATVVDFDVPFAKLAMFFMRAVFAALPALLVLTAILWAFGQGLQMFFPQLLKMKVLIYMP